MGQAHQVTGESEKSIKYNILKREVDSNRQLYDTMLQQLKQSTIAAAMRASNIRVVDPARVPKRPYKPDAPLNSALGLFAGAFIGAAFIIMHERVDHTIQDPGDTPLYLNVPELGVIPPGAAELSPRQLAKIRLSKSIENGNGNGFHPTEEISPASSLADERVELVTWQRRPSMIAESFRSALISILFSGENGNRPKVMVLTSAGPGEGKSTMVSNLGIAIAEIGQKVLLIDADMRKPRLHDIFGKSNERGLSDLLRESKQKNGTGSLEGLIHETDVPGLFLLTSGPAATTATNLLYGPQLPMILKQLRGEFETILIDTPPMLQIPDARVVGRVADRVILVVRAGKTTRDAAIAARQRFSEDGTQVLGTILNDWNQSSSVNGHMGTAKGITRVTAVITGRKRDERREFYRGLLFVAAAWQVGNLPHGGFCGNLGR